MTQGPDDNHDAAKDAHNPESADHKDPAPDDASTSAVEQEWEQQSAPSLTARLAHASSQILSRSWVISVGAVVLALVIGSVLILLGDADVQATAGYFFSRPTDFLQQSWAAISGSYVSLFQGAVFDNEAPTFVRAIRPLTETLTISAPLILAGLGIGLTFRAGLFNIGGQSQLVLGAIVGAWVGFALHLPPVLHAALVVIAAALGGAVAGAIPGVLKARFGAHEVITTIMLNNTSKYFLLLVLGTAAFASGTPQVSPNLDSSAMLWNIFGSPFRLHLGFVLTLAAAIGVWWLMERSVLGFQMRAVGANPEAAKTAGMNVSRLTVVAMALSGALCGLAAAMQIAGTEGKLTGSVYGSIGFDAITVALLGRSRPLGTVFAGLLFGALAAGGRMMATRAGTEAELVMVLQAVIVLFIAAPPLVRAVFRLPDPDRKPKQPKATSEATTAEVTA